MKELSIEEKAQAYDGLIERLKDLKFAYRFSPLSDTIEEKFPELREESEDERIRKELIKLLRNLFNNYSYFIKDPFYTECIAWLEKQGEHAKFCDSIQVGDKVTRNRDGMLVNLSQFKRVAKPTEEYNIRGIGSKHAEGKLKELIEKQCEQKLDEISNVCEFSIETWIKIVDYVLTEHNGIGNYLIDPEVKDTAEKLQKKYKFDAASEEWDRVYRKGLDAGVNKGKAIALKEQKPDDKIQLGKKYKCIASPRYTAFMKGSIYEPKDKFLCSLMNFCSDCFEPIEEGEQNPADKVEPKFKVGDWIVNNEYNNIAKVLEVNGQYLLDYCNTIGAVSIELIDTDYHLWTIQDAKDGDVLCCESGWTCIFKELNHNSFGEKLFDSHCFIDKTKWFHNGAKGHTLNERINGKIYPATEEQRDLLFQKIKEAGYEWDAKKKELTKIEQKHFCKLDNSYARVKFPFKAKVKSSGKIVTIHDGQLSYDGKEWIKYQSDAKDGYKIYEPNNLLESVCETEQNPVWGEEDEYLLDETVKHLEALIRITKKQGSAYSDEIQYYKRDIDWLKSLKDRCLSHPQS